MLLNLICRYKNSPRLFSSISIIIFVLSFQLITNTSYADSSGVEVVVDAVGLKDIKYNGQSYWFAGSAASIGGTLVSSVRYKTPSGDIKPYGWYENSLQPQLSIGSATRSVLSNPSGFQHIYRDGLEDSFTVKVTYTPLDNRTLQIDTYVTNNDPTDTLEFINFYSGFLPIKTPGPAREYDSNIPLSIGPMNQWFKSPVAFLSGDWGSIAYWIEDYSTNWNTFAYYGGSAQTQFGFYLQNSSFNTKQVYHDPIPPKQTKKFTTFLRFGSSSDTAQTLAPEAFTSLRNSYPQITNWSKRTPIARWFISEGTKRSQTNPRGYFWDPNLDVSNQENFRSKALSQADNIINLLNSMNPRPQGILVWDLEGQEFNHAFTYVGYPNKLPDIAPEMDKVADELFAKFRNAGYEIGMTIRPQKFQTGYTLPSTCDSRSGGSTRDVFIKIDGPYLSRNYVCVSPNTWQVTAFGPGHQTDVNDDNEVYELLKSKISYAKNRWGAKIFYVDSSVYTSGEPLNFKIFRKLQQDFPDVVLFPEIWNNMYWSSVSTYLHGAFGFRDVPQAVKSMYPNAFSVLQVIDGVNLDDAQTNNALIDSVKRGNILFIDGWYNPPSNDKILKIYRDAATISTGTTNNTTPSNITTSPNTTTPSNTEPTCPSASVSLINNSIQVGQNTIASVPLGWSGGIFRSSDTSVANVFGDVITALSPGTVSVSGIGWTAPNGAKNCSLAEASLTISPTPPPTLDLKANNQDGPLTVEPGSSITLSWNSTNASVCRASGSWSGEKRTYGSEFISNIVSSKEYILTCGSNNNNVQDSVIVNVFPSNQSAKQGNVSGTGNNSTSTSASTPGSIPASASMSQMSSNNSTNANKNSSLTTPPERKPLSLSDVKFYRDLKRGNRGDDVKKLQSLLSKDPTLYPSKLITGYFGYLTEMAVMKFQCKYKIVCGGNVNITGYGRVGSKTRAKLQEIFGN